MGLVKQRASCANLYVSLADLIHFCSSSDGSVLSVDALTGKMNVQLSLLILLMGALQRNF